MTTPITAGDLLPPMVFTLGDRAQVADFSMLSASSILIRCYLLNKLLLDSVATSVQVASDHKSIQVTRTWNAGETDKHGLWRVIPTVIWIPGIEQTFPGMVLEVRKVGT